jgi:hypothetical protein
MPWAPAGVTVSVARGAQPSRSADAHVGRARPSLSCSSIPAPSVGPEKLEGRGFTWLQAQQRPAHRAKRRQARHALAFRASISTGA